MLSLSIKHLRIEKSSRRGRIREVGLEENTWDVEGDSTITEIARFGHDFSRVRVHGGALALAQSKLKLNRLGDVFEQEADRVADHVMDMPEPQLQIACPCGGGCPKCRKEHDSRPQLQTKWVQANAQGGLPGPPIVQEATDSSGQLLEQSTRKFMELRFGHDFSQVRVHTDARAVESARTLNALAYTSSRDIVFGAGQYAPNTHEGRRLLAHELAHVVQQGGNHAIVQRQAAPTMTPATDQDRREFVQMTIDFFNSSAEFFRDQLARIDQALFERMIDNWYLMVIDREGMIDSSLGGDAALKMELRAAYTAAIRVLISRATTIFNKSENELYRENSGRIPMWAWPTPHSLEPGISTPIAEGRAVDVVTGHVTFATNGFDISIVPDVIDPRLGSRAETRIDINWQLPGYQWQWQGGQKRITAFNAPPPVTVRIQTFYGPHVTAASRSGYGRGTTPQDIAGDRVTTRSTSLGFHEGSHGLAYVEFLEANPAPQFTGRVGMTEAQFQAARNQWANDLRDYSRRIRAFSTRFVDCVGTTIDQYNQARAAAGIAVQIVCGP